MQIHTVSEGVVPHATEEQIKKASTLIKRIDLRDFSVCQFANPGTCISISTRILCICCYFDVVCSYLLISFAIEQAVTSHAALFYSCLHLITQITSIYNDYSLSVLLFVALQRHYGALQVFALGEDEMPDIKDETLPDEEGLSR